VPPRSAGSAGPAEEAVDGADEAAHGEGPDGSGGGEWPDGSGGELPDGSGGGGRGKGGGGGKRGGGKNRRHGGRGRGGGGRGKGGGGDKGGGGGGGGGGDGQRQPWSAASARDADGGHSEEDTVRRRSGAKVGRCAHVTDVTVCKTMAIM
jgi:translation initiation factor IF-2